MNKNINQTNATKYLISFSAYKNMKINSQKRRFDPSQYILSKPPPFQNTKKYTYDNKSFDNPKLNRNSSEGQFRQDYSKTQFLFNKKKYNFQSNNFHKKSNSSLKTLKQVTKKQFKFIKPSNHFKKDSFNQSQSIDLGIVKLSPEKNNEKKQFRPWQTYKMHQLKQTAETFTTKTSSINLNHYPSFVKSKSNKIICNQTSQQLSIDNFQILRKLGSGKFGKVLLVKDKKTEFMMAMKVFEKKKIIESNHLDQFIKQLKIQAYLNFPSIIKLYGYFHDQYNFYCLMELGCDGELYKMLKSKRVLSQGATSYVVRQLLLTVDYIHSKNIVHRDIKPQNIVMIHGSVKLCDFGWATETTQLRGTYCGTPLYLSPQILKGSLYNQKVDIWSIGVMAYEMLIGSSPFQIKNSRQLYKIVTQPLRFPLKYTSSMFKQFVACILQKNPKQRMSAKQLLCLEFMKKYEGDEVFQQLLTTKQSSKIRN